MKPRWIHIKVLMRGIWIDCVTRGTRRAGKLAVRLNNEFGASMWVLDNSESWKGQI